LEVNTRKESKQKKKILLLEVNTRKESKQKKKSF